MAVQVLPATNAADDAGRADAAIAAGPANPSSTIMTVLLNGQVIWSEARSHARFTVGGLSVGTHSLAVALYSPDGTRLRGPDEKAAREHVGGEGFPDCFAPFKIARRVWPSRDIAHAAAVFYDGFPLPRHLAFTPSRLLCTQWGLPRCHGMVSLAPSNLFCLADSACLYRQICSTPLLAGRKR